jgi:hypothetical protein
MSVNKIWLARFFILLITAWNVQAGVVFMLSPVSFVRAYELSGEAGEAAVRGVGVLFLMWSVPYFFAVWNPLRYKLALTCAVLMQVVGLAGESYILSTLSMEHEILRTSILRFIAFDGVGLFLLMLAYFLVRHESDPT